MPAFDYSPLGMLSFGFDLSHIAGEELYRTDGAISVYAPGEVSSYADIYDLLCGLGSESSRTLAGVLNTARESAELPGEFTVHISGNGTGQDASNGLYREDRIVIGYSQAFTVHADTEDNPYGFNVEPTSSIEVDGVHYVTAPNNYTRGVIRAWGNSSILRLTVSPTVATAFQDSVFQSIPVMVRGWNENDTLSGANGLCLSGLENEGPWVNDVDVTAKWILNAEGYVEFWRNDDRSNLVWVNDSLREFLGFTGKEIDLVIVDSGFIVTRATYRPHGMLWLNRPIEYIEPRLRAKRRLAEASDGQVDTAHLSTRKGWVFRFVARGLAESEDATVEALDGFFSYLWKAPHLTVYQNVNEVRRAVSRIKGYSVEVCGEDNYRVGRLRLVLDSDIDRADFNLEDPRIRNRYFFELSGNEYVP